MPDTTQLAKETTMANTTIPDTTQPAKETTMANTTMPDQTQPAEETTINRFAYCIVGWQSFYRVFISMGNMA